MNKVLALFLAMILMLGGKVTVFASESGEGGISTDTLFASEETYTSIVKNLNTEQIDQFFDGDFDEEVALDMQHLVPVYMLTGNSSDNTLQSMLEFTNTYNVMVYSKSSEVLGTAALAYYENMWVVGTFYVGYDMLGKIGTFPANTDQTFYYIDNPYMHEEALLIAGQNGETYCSLTNSRGTVNAGKILDEINEIQRLNGGDILVDDTGANADNTTLISYIVSSSIIIIFAIVVLSFIWRKKARR